MKKTINKERRINKKGKKKEILKRNRKEASRLTIHRLCELFISPGFYCSGHLREIITTLSVNVCGNKSDAVL